METLNQFLEESPLSKENKKQAQEIYQASLDSFRSMKEILESEDWAVDRDDFDEDDVMDDLDWDTTINDAIDELVDRKREEKKDELEERLREESRPILSLSPEILQGVFRPFLQIWSEYAKAKNFFISDETLEKIVCGDLKGEALDLDTLEGDFIYFLKGNLPKEKA